MNRLSCLAIVGAIISINVHAQASQPVRPSVRLVPEDAQLQVLAVDHLPNARPLPVFRVPGGEAIASVAPIQRGAYLAPAVSIRGRRWRSLVVRPTARYAEVETGNMGFRDNAPAFPRKLAVITHSRYLHGLAYLDAFIDWKQQNGWQVSVYDESRWNPAGQVGQQAADVLRAWLKANYQSEGIGYVLLVGDADPTYGLVPMKMVWPLKAVCDKTGDSTMCEMQRTPTDYYYSDLEGDWDLDGDGFAGEHPDDTNVGGVDLGPEVIVGRFPVMWEPSYVDGLLAQSVRYMSESDLTGRNRVLLAGAMLNFKGLGSAETPSEDGANATQAMGQHLASLDSKLVFTRMTEQEGFAKSAQPTDYSLTEAHLQEAFLYGHGLTVWYAHGYPTYTERMIWKDDANQNGVCDWEEFQRATMLQSFSTGPFAASPVQTMAWQISCLNGFPEIELNLGLAMLFANAVATTVATRSAFGESQAEPGWEPDPSLAGAETMAYFWAEKLAGGSSTVGDAVAFTKYGIPSDGWDEAYPPGMLGVSYAGIGLYDKMVFNLYGDPTLSWRYEGGAHGPGWPPAEGDAGSDASDGSPQPSSEAGIDAPVDAKDGSVVITDAAADQPAVDSCTNECNPDTHLSPCVDELCPECVDDGCGCHIPGGSRFPSTAWVGIAVALAFSGTKRRKIGPCER